MKEKGRNGGLKEGKGSKGDGSRREKEAGEKGMLRDKET